MKRKICSKCWEEYFEIVRPDGINEYLLRCVSCKAIIKRLEDKMTQFLINEEIYRDDLHTIDLFDNVKNSKD